MWDLIAQHFWIVPAFIFSLGGVRILAAVFGLGIPTALLFARAGGIVQAGFEFLKTPVGQAVAVVLIIMSAFVAGDVHRTRLDLARERAADAARLEHDADIRRAIANDAAQRIAEIQRQADALQSQVAAYEQTLSTQNAAACRATSADVRELRKF